MMLSTLLLGARALGASWTVGPGGDFANLADAVEGAGNGDTITLASGTWAACVSLGGKDLTLRGAGSSATVLDGAGACEDALEATSGEALTLRGLALQNPGGRGLRLAGGASLVADDLLISDSGDAALDGGGLYVDGGSATLRRSALTGNVGADGGNLYVTGGATVRLEDVELSLGSASSGGGLYASAEGGPVALVFVAVNASGNQASAAGGALFLDRGSTLDSSASVYVSNGGAAAHGAAIYTRADTTILSAGDTFSDNAAADLSLGGCGGAVYLGARGALTVSDALFQRNSAYSGGAIYQETDGTVALQDAIFDRNHSYENGGAVYGIDGLELSVARVDFTDNAALYGDGGALAVLDVGGLDVQDALFEGNEAWSDGGAVYLDYAVDARFASSRFLDNAAGERDGGALRHGFYGALTVTGCAFEGNSAAGLGGAVALDYLATTAVFEETSFTSNTSTRGDGGALGADDYGSLSLSFVTMQGNQAAYEGGALYAALWGDVEIADSALEDNVAHAGNGGAAYLAPADSGLYDLSVLRSSISGNSAGRHGGGLYGYGLGELALDQVTVDHNAADGDGPGFYHGGGAYLYQVKYATVSGSRFCANSAANGGGVYASQIPAGTNTWTNNLFVENTALNLGGGAYFGNSKGQSFRHNAVVGNAASTGGGVYARSSATAFSSNIVAWTVEGNGMVGGDLSTGSGSTHASSDWYANTTLDVSGTYRMTLGEAGNIDEDPGFVSYTLDGDCENDQLWLSADSALVDAGEAGELDPDGSPADIGPYGGADALAPDEDGDGHGTVDWGGDDCDDADASVHPGADERCDEVDQDCDGAVDEDAIDAGSWYADADADGYGAPGLITGCDAPSPWADDGDDCDDAAPGVNPAEAEITNDGVDQDCDGVDRLDMDGLAYGDLVLSELMADPTMVEGAVGEWFEIANTTAAQVDLAGLVLSDADTDRYVVPSALLVGPGETALFAVRADSSVNGGLPTPDHVWTRRVLRFDNVTDELILSSDTVEFDRLEWGTGRALSITAGATLSLDPLRLDPDANDAAYAWCAPAATYGLGDHGSPDAANESCGVSPLSPDDLTAGELLITEIMLDCSAVLDPVGEWVEIYNLSGSPVDLSGLVLADEGVDRLTVGSTVVVEDGAFAVLASRSSPALNGGNTEVDYQYDRKLFRLDDAADEVLLQNAAGVTLDRVAWSAGWDLVTGASLSLDAAEWDASANDLYTAWCAASSAYGLGDLGTPGSANDACALDADEDGFPVGEDCDDADPAVYPGAPELEDDGLDQDCDGLDQRGLASLVVGDLVLTEVMANTLAVEDAVGEWFEVYNATDAVVNLRGLVLSDLDTDRTTVEADVLVEPAGYALFAVRADALLNGGLPTVDHVWTRLPFRFDNTADEIVLSYAGLELDRLAWGSRVGLLAAEGASLSLDAESLDAISNDDPAAWCAGGASYGLGDRGTPGAANAACAVAP